MAPKIVNSEKGKIKIRFFEVELEGGDETLLEGIKAAAAAMNRPQPPRTLAPASTPAAARLAAKFSGHTLDEAATVQDSSSNSADDHEAEADSEAEPTKAPNVPRKRPNRAFPIPRQLEDLALKDGSPTWKEFAEAKAPTSHTNRAIVMAKWLRDHRQILEFGIDHLYTCFRWMKWPLPADIGSVLRGLKAADYAKAVGDGTYTLQMMGEKKFDEL